MINCFLCPMHLIYNIFFLDEVPKVQHFAAEILQKEYCQAVKVISV